MYNQNGTFTANQFIHAGKLGLELIYAIDKPSSGSTDRIEE